MKLEPHPPPPPTPSKKWTCAGDRCVGGGVGNGTHPDASCSGECPALATDEWLAQDCCGIWRRGAGATLVALKPTWLKKSLAFSSSLPASEKRAVQPGGECRLVPGIPAVGTYLVCTAPS